MTLPLRIHSFGVRESASLMKDIRQLTEGRLSSSLTITTITAKPGYNIYGSGTVEVV